MAGTGKDKTSAFITSTKDSIILKNSSHCPAANHLPLTAGVHLGNKVPGAVLHSIHFFWINGFIKVTAALQKPRIRWENARPGLHTPFPSFLLHTMNPRRDTFRAKESDLRGSHTQQWGGNLLPECHGYPGWKLHT